MAPPISGITYRRACIAAEATCADSERTAALEDWVSAVYLADSRSTACADHVAAYDNRLSDAERRCVESEIGPLPQADPDAVAAFFEQARQWYFDHLPSHVTNAARCRRPMRYTECPGPVPGPCTVWPFSVQGHGYSPSGSIEWISFGAYNNCPIEFARLFYESGAERAVAAHAAPDPEAKWIFFVEGYQQFLANRSAAPDARGYFARIATILRIPIYDAVQRTYRHPDVIDWAARHSLFRPDQLLTVTYLADYIDRTRAGETAAAARDAVAHQIIADGHAEIVPAFLDEVDGFARGIINLHDRFFILYSAVSSLMPDDQQRIARQEYSGGTLHALCVLEPTHLRIFTNPF